MAIFKIMPNLENITKGLSVLSASVPLFARFGKSLTKTAIKSGIIVYAESKGLITGASDALEEILSQKLEPNFPNRTSSSARSSR
ncbi:hypothetical protein NIES2101_32425 [Calothrix sp. HK-06]|nr:hypothetical protein NIES2101_32425 [Calothrix sp. HK-06]